MPLPSRHAWAEPSVETVAPGVHRAPVPLPHDGLRAISVYVIEESDGVVLVDAGWDSPLAREAVAAGLDAAGAGVGDIHEILVTHVHYDHVGGATPLVREGARGYWMGAAEEPSFDVLVTDPVTSRAKRYDQLQAYGADDLVARGRATKPLASEPFDMDPPRHWAAHEDVYRLGGTALRALHTPGHTRGHLCFHDADRRLLFSGDHVLPHITPSIGFESATNTLALADFLRSLAAVRTLDVDLVLPAHGPVFDDLAGRVDALAEHHDERLARCVAALPADGSMSTAAAVATILPWTRRETPFEDLNHFNQLLATWETIAHMELLAARGEIVRSVDGDHGRISFRRVRATPG